MKSKGGGGLFGIFRKKTTPAPAAPTAQLNDISERSGEKNTSETTTVDESTSSSTDSQVGPPEVMDQPRKESIAKTSVIHYSPPGTVRTSLPPSVPSSVSGTSSEDPENQSVVITRKSNIVLDDEESVVSTPISQYDESPIIHKSRKKRTAPAPPAPAPPLPSPSSNAPPILPPHRSQGNDYEGMLKKLQTKFDEWNQVRIEDGGSVREERIKAEVFKDHQKLKVLLEKEITSAKPPSVTNNNNYVKLAPKPVSVPVPGGTVYQKPIRSSKKTDENRNEVVSGQNSAAVDRLRKEVEEQRQREREVKEYRNPKAISQVSPPAGPRMVEYTPMKNRQKSLEDEGVTPPPIPKTPPPKLSEYRKESPRMPTVPANGFVRLQVTKKTAPVSSSKKTYAPLPYTGPEYASSPKLLRKSPVSPEPKVQQTVVKEHRVYESPQQHPQMIATSPTAIHQKTAPQVPAHYQKITVNATSSPYQKTSPKSPATSPVPTNYIRQAKDTVAQNSTSSNVIYQKTAATSPKANGITTAMSPYQKVSPKSPATSPVPTTYTQAKDTKAQNATSSNFIYQKTTATSPTPNRATVSKPNGITAATSPVPTTFIRQAKDTVAGNATSSNGIYQKTMATSPKPNGVTTATSPSPNRATVPKPNGITSTLSATSPIYQKVTVVQVPAATSSSPLSPKPTREKSTVTSPKVSKKPQATVPFVAGPVAETFDISDVLKGPKLRKVGMPVERSGISVGKVLDSPVAPAQNRPSTVPPPPPPPPIAPVANVVAGPKNMDLRDSLMNEIRQAGRLRAARASQNA